MGQYSTTDSGSRPWEEDHSLSFGGSCQPHSQHNWRRVLPSKIHCPSCHKEGTPTTQKSLSWYIYHFVLHHHSFFLNITTSTLYKAFSWLTVFHHSPTLFFKHHFINSTSITMAGGCGNASCSCASCGCAAGSCTCGVSISFQNTTPPLPYCQRSLLLIDYHSQIHQQSLLTCQS